MTNEIKDRIKDLLDDFTWQYGVDIKSITIDPTTHEVEVVLDDD